MKEASTDLWASFLVCGGIDYVMYGGKVRPLDTIKSAFLDELEKIAALAIGKGQNTTAAGIYAYEDGDGDRRAALGAEISDAVKKHKSVLKAHAALQKKYPTKDFTVMFKREDAPTDPGKLKRLGWTLIGQKKKRMAMHDSAKRSFEDRKANPRMFVRVGHRRGYQMNALSKEVSRGLYDSELNQPHVRKKDRVVYA